MAGHDDRRPPPLPFRPRPRCGETADDYIAFAGPGGGVACRSRASGW